MNWIQIAPTIGAAFLASAVECVEAATIVLAVGTSAIFYSVYEAGRADELGRGVERARQVVRK